MHDGLTVHQVNLYMYKHWANFTNKKLQAEPHEPTTLMWRLVVLHTCYYSYTSSYLNFLYLCTYSIHDEFVRYNRKVLHHQCVGDCRLIMIHHAYWSDTVTIYFHTKYYMSNIDIFVNCSWVDTRWQQYSTHLHTNNIQNNTIRNFGWNTFWDLNPEWSNKLGRVRAVPRLCELYPAFALQLRKKHRKTSLRVAEECQMARWKLNIENRAYINNKNT